MMPHIRTYRFYVTFDDDGRVNGKADPFGGIFSVDGKPSKPAHFCSNHKERYFDIIRGSSICVGIPVSRQVSDLVRDRDGQQPAGQSPIGEYFNDEIHESEHPFPYYVSEFPGDQPVDSGCGGLMALGKGAMVGLSLL